MKLVQVAERDLDELWQAIQAVSQLNSWVRSPDVAQRLFAPKRAVYWLKGQAIGAALKYADWFSTQERKIRVEVQCRDCGGSGNYVDWDCRDRGKCRRCDGGVAQLYFKEIRMNIPPQEIIWHSPTIGNRETHELVEDWQPHQPGRSLEPWQAAQAFNIAEPYFWAHPMKRWSNYRMEEFYYTLNVGNLAHKRCCFCGTTENLDFGGGTYVTRKPIAFHVWNCADCRKRILREQGRLDWAIAYLPSEEFPYPYQLVHHPQIMKWMERHETVY